MDRVCARGYECLNVQCQNKKNHDNRDRKSKKAKATEQSDWEKRIQQWERKRKEEYNTIESLSSIFQGNTRGILDQAQECYLWPDALSLSSGLSN